MIFYISTDGKSDNREVWWMEEEDEDWAWDEDRARVEVL